MGLESLPHLALGNTKKGLTNIVIGGNNDNSNGLSHTEWLIKQKEDIKEQAYQTGRGFIAAHTRTINAMCKASSEFSPTLKSLAYFSDIDNLTSRNRQSQVLMNTKNPVGFGAMVYKETQNLVSDLGGRVSYHRPSEFVGLEFAKKGLLVKKSFYIDYNSQAAVRVADEHESKLGQLDYLFESINTALSGITAEALAANNELVASAVIEVLDLYHLYIKASVEAGISCTAIEDRWLNKKIPAARDFAPKLLDMYSYAEKYQLAYNTPYPSYKSSEGDLRVLSEFNRTNPTQYALYSEIFDYIKAKAVISTIGNRYQLGHLISQNTYMQALIEDLTGFYQQVSNNFNLETLRQIA